MHCTVYVNPKLPVNSFALPPDARCILKVALMACAEEQLVGRRGREESRIIKIFEEGWSPFTEMEKAERGVGLKRASGVPF